MLLYAGMPGGMLSALSIQTAMVSYISKFSFLINVVLDILSVRAAYDDAMDRKARGHGKKH